QADDCLLRMSRVRYSVWIGKVYRCHCNRHYIAHLSRWNRMAGAHSDWLIYMACIAGKSTLESRSPYDTACWERSFMPCHFCWMHRQCMVDLLIIRILLMHIGIAQPLCLQGLPMACCMHLTRLAAMNCLPMCRVACLSGCLHGCTIRMR